MVLLSCCLYNLCWYGSSNFWAFVTWDFCFHIGNNHGLKDIWEGLPENLILALSLSFSHFSKDDILDPTSFVVRMFVSVKRFGFNEWINVLEQKCPKSENDSLALKLHSAKGRVRNGIGGIPAHWALALRATTYQLCFSYNFKKAKKIFKLIIPW